jgi:F-type H+-transporting ATPase subunit a
MEFLQIKQNIPNVSPDIVFYFFGWPVSNSFLLSFLVLIIFAGISLFLNINIKKGYNNFLAFCELFYETVINFLAKLAGGEKNAKFILPLSASIFFYILVSNLITIVPGLTSIKYDGVSIFRSPTSDFNTTFGLALGMIVIINIMALKDYGFFDYISKFLQFGNVFKSFKKGIKEGILSLVNFGIGILDILSEFAKIVSLSLRLFGNVYAGEVLIVILFGALAFVVPTIWMSMSLLFGFVQAIVFSSLVTVYYAGARKSDKV